VPPPSSPGEAPGEPLDKRQDVTSENAMVLTAGLRAVRERIKLPWLRGDARHAMAAFALCLATACFAPVDSKAADQKESGGPWLATVAIIRNEEQPGSGVYLGSGLIITAAHLTAVDAKMSVRIAGIALPATVLKQGSAEDIDLSILLVDEQKLPANIRLPRMQLCEAPPWPGDPVIVVDDKRASRSHIISPKVLRFTLRTKFSTLIGDVANTGNSGAGVFDPNRKCLLGIISGKFTSHAAEEGDKEIAKYFVSAAVIRDFMPADLRP
jgi:Trypsin-like peptidase domain